MLSIIVPVFKNKSLLYKFFDEMKKQEDLNFELIFIFDTNQEDVLEIVDENIDFFKNKIKMYYNSNRLGRPYALKEGVKKASGEYVLIANLNASYPKNTIQLLNQLYQYNRTDIIEFRARIRSPFKFRGIVRKEIFLDNKNAKNEGIAFTYPIDFNKLFKKEILVKVFDNLDEQNMYNSQFSIAHVLKAFYFAKTYSNSNVKIIRLDNEKNNLLRDLRAFSLIQEWNEFFIFLNEEKNQEVISEKEYENLKDAYLYLMFYHKVFFIPSSLSLAKNESGLKKYKEYLNAWIDTFIIVSLNNNPYFQDANNKESKVFKSAKNFATYTNLLWEING